MRPAAWHQSLQQRVRNPIMQFGERTASFAPPPPAVTRLPAAACRCLRLPLRRQCWPSASLLTLLCFPPSVAAAELLPLIELDWTPAGSGVDSREAALALLRPLTVAAVPGTTSPLQTGLQRALLAALLERGLQERADRWLLRSVAKQQVSRRLRRGSRRLHTQPGMNWAHSPNARTIPQAPFLHTADWRVAGAGGGAGARRPGRSLSQAWPEAHRPSDPAGGCWPARGGPSRPSCALLGTPALAAALRPAACGHASAAAAAGGVATPVGRTAAAAASTASTCYSSATLDGRCRHGCGEPWRWRHCTCSGCG